MHKKAGNAHNPLQNVLGEISMSVLEVKNASIRYITGDFKNIGLKEYVMRRLTHNYSVTEFWADRNISFSL